MMNELGEKVEENHGAVTSETDMGAETSHTETTLPQDIAEKLMIQKDDSLNVKLAIYDGPLELLLELIQKNQMDICDIQVSVITSQYLEKLAEMKLLDLEIAGEFLVMAATLIYIKSKMLLPDETLEEEEDGVDPRSELVRKLMEYQAFKEAAKELSILELERSKVFTRQISDYYFKDLQADDSEVETFSADMYDLLAAFQKVLTSKGRKNLHEVYEEVISIDQKISEIRALLLGQKEISFFELFDEKYTRNELIATFLALLELIKARFAIVIQPEQFGDILIQKTDESNMPTQEIMGED
jgi:segregation and condensation protein A